MGTFSHPAPAGTRERGVEGMPEIKFHGTLADIRDARKGTPSRRSFPRAAKDLIETLGIPHTEIGRLTVNGLESSLLQPVGFDDRLDAFPHIPPRPSPWKNDGKPDFPGDVAFIADINVAGAGKLLRALGFDTLMDPGLDDREIARRAHEENRVVLSRDRNLLKRRLVLFGCLIRSEEPWKQLAEIVRQYGLACLSKPFSRCVRCNAILVPVDKEKVMDRLQPMTRLFYDSFHTCPSCGRVFWKGSHTLHMLEKIEPLLAEGR
jgi:uncharacterized protein with PIN domain